MPKSSLRRRAPRIKPHLRNRRILSLEMLELRHLLSTTSVIDDASPVPVSHSGSCGCPICSGQGLQDLIAADEAATNSGTGIDSQGALAALSSTFALHSNPTAQHTIYLDFTGHVTSGTSWNGRTGGANIVTPAFSLDGDFTTFSNAELTRIQAIWQRVAEDFSPFHVNVTTQEPGNLGDLIKSGTGDTRWGVRVCIGGSSSDWYGSSAGGVAYVGSFNYSSDTPAFVFTAQLGSGAEKYTSEAITHETGHTLGLRHDGTSATSYYQGQGSGVTGWAPIMGNAYYKNLTQWSKGQYSGANNLEDDLSIITTSNGFGYRTDDYGNTAGTAALLSQVDTTVSGSGIIERNTDADVFSFVTGVGLVNLNITPAARGTDLDILAQLYDGANNLIATSNAPELLGASFSLTLSAGQYFLKLSGTGKGDPLTTGYTNYASLGQYFISGTVIPGSVDTFLTLGATSASKAEGNTGSTDFTFTVTRTGDASGTTTVDWSVIGSGANPAGAADFSGGVVPSGTLTFASGEVSKVITVSVAGDTAIETDEGFTVTLSGASSPAQILLGGTATGTIVNDDVAPAAPTLSIAAASADKLEGNSGSNSFTFKITRSGNLTGTSSVRYAVASTGANVATAADFTGGVLPSGTVNFAAGQSSVTVQIMVNGETSKEANEQFKVTLSSASGATISTGVANGTIKNDDNGPQKGEVIGEQPEESTAGLAIVFSERPTASNSEETNGKPESPDTHTLRSEFLVTPWTGLCQPGLAGISSAIGATSGADEPTDAIFHSLELSSDLGSSELELGWVSL